MPNPQRGFSVIGGGYIAALLSKSKSDIIDIVAQCYRLHQLGGTNNPDSYFLRFDDKPEARIIALPAAIRDADRATSVSGIKWIGSYPRNIESNLQRASAVIVLNDYETGYPFACLEASQISSARTAASAVLAAGQLGPRERRARRLGVIGGGLIASTIVDYFKAAGWQFDDVCVHDLSPDHAATFARNLSARGAYPVRVGTRDEALDADLVVLATTAGAPWIPVERRFTPSQLVLNVSLRDLPPETLLTANNVFDDVDHCMKANTSPHLAEQRYGHRDFVSGTIGQSLLGELRVDPGKPTIFSPFGLGVLDLAVAMHIYERALAEHTHHPIPDFFATTDRWTQ
ncbi:2,3-diaminopropionate biosynthesis protein SbnB [Burkholderia ubonensis]|uniref:2,3-diaminopropionate biosynthesis protein SbnB n=1 Tax=Burkholderia ubonensis subsp. mesacidophila TaxID=265293 RepID=A0A2A4FM03_9BURK|nr:2,3-diaminopropionate biosynthesis protein SbnB [Burkholderia ubonensis]PCE33702.1 2,3-diaminopropionate biosynthesis protein SbnB [Burkholderia ubonensis subsp. mesacidophila]